MFLNIFKKKKTNLYRCILAFPNFQIITMMLNEQEIFDINFTSGIYIINYNEVLRAISSRKGKL